VLAGAGYCTARHAAHVPDQLILIRFSPDCDRAFSGEITKHFYVKRKHGRGDRWNWPKEGKKPSTSNERHRQQLPAAARE
jgi:hypothetical protein